MRGAKSGHAHRWPDERRRVLGKLLSDHRRPRPDDRMTFEEARAQFPVLERLAYMNAGTNGPLAAVRPPRRRRARACRPRARRGGSAYFEHALELRDPGTRQSWPRPSARARVAPLATSTTNGCNIVLAGLGLRPGDEVLTTDGEHFGLLGAESPPRRLRCAWPRCVTSRPTNVRRAARRRDAETRLIALSHVCWVTGNRFPIAELREATGLPVLCRGRRSERRCDGRRGDRGRLLCILPEVALRPGFDGRARRARPGVAHRGCTELPLTAGLRTDRRVYAARRRRPFDPGWTPPPSLAGLDAALDLAPEGRFERAAENAARCRELIAERFEVLDAPRA